jgi:hypothetical protein
MDFSDRLKELAGRLPDKLDYIATEEATKNALVLPFISALGYNVFDPLEVVPEFTCDVGTKKGEKVDYALMRDGRPIVLFECKTAGCPLDVGRASQLFRYFTATDTRFAVLTDGIVYQFFSDLDQSNKMDSKAFLEVDLRDLREAQIKELKRFTKSSFDETSIVAVASELKYAREIRRVIDEESREPSEEFLRMIVSRVYDGRFTKAVHERFADLVKRAFAEFLHEKVNARLQSALASETAPLEGNEEAEEEAEEVVTTPEEIEAFYIVKSILREVTDVSRVHIRDAKTYCSVILDNNNRKPICRLHFNSRQKYLGIFDAEKNETRHAIDALDQIYRHSAALAETVFRYVQAEQPV